MEQRVLVTGASRGLGAALARAVARRGHRVLLAARISAELELRAAEIARQHGSAAVAWHACDLRDGRQVDALAATATRVLGGVDVLINNAGIGAYRPFLENRVEELDEVLALNLAAPMRLAHALLPGMIERGGGYLIHVASDLARRPLARMAPYVASKHGLLGLAASLHREFRADGIRVTTVLPGIIDSAFNGATEGSREARWALPTDALAEQIAGLIDLPPTIVVDELVVHPADGDY
jgi:short-subunit dehydrogenase